MSDDEIMHIRRGALLHDMGKIGIPDSILHKPAALTDEEWTVMRKHPQLSMTCSIRLNIYALPLKFPLLITKSGMGQAIRAG